MTSHETLLMICAIVLAALFVGCGNQAWRVNASVARAMLEVQAESGPVIRELRVQAGVNAGREVHDRGGPEIEAQAAAVDAADRWDCAIEEHRIYSSMVGAYIDALALRVNDSDFELMDALPFVRRALAAYRALASCLASLESDALPETPEFLNLIPPAWSVTE